jgi:hypothetical protein
MDGIDMNKLSALLLTASLIAPSFIAPAIAVSPEAKSLPPEKACVLNPVSWVREDRLPPVIRSAPSHHAPVIGTIVPERLEGEEDARGVDLRVDRIAGDFVHVAALPAIPERGLRATPAGWVQQDGVFFTMQTAAGFSRPSEKSRQVFATDDWIYRKMIVRIEECRGEWLKLVVANDDDYDADDEDNGRWTFTTAWFRGFCGNEETTCDGVTGDNPTVSK